MELRKISVAIAALAFAATASAWGDKSPSATSGSQKYAADQSASSTSAGNQGASSSNQGQSSSSHAMSSSNEGMSNDMNASGSSSSSTGNESTVRSAQQALKDKGYDVGTADGKMGPRTEDALKQFQQAQGLPQTGDLDQQTLSKLGVSEGGGASSAASSGPSGATTSASSPSGSNSMSSPSKGATGSTSASPGASSNTSSNPSSSSSTSPKY
jgi:hypothetical protein